MSSMSLAMVTLMSPLLTNTMSVGSADLAAILSEKKIAGRP
jgi:hypothetical protein